jgi:hypothetical protein
MAAPILLYDTVYLTDLAGPGTRLWAPAEAGLILVALAVALALVWNLLNRLAARSSGQSVAFALSLSCAAAGVTVMMSGYLTGGQVGLPLAAALAGVALASFFLPAQPNTGNYLGVGVVGLFSIVLLGRLFGTLPTGSALGLLLAPLFAWIPEGPGLRRLGPRLRAVSRLVMVAIPLVFVVADAQRKFSEEFGVTTKWRHAKTTRRESFSFWPRANGTVRGAG